MKTPQTIVFLLPLTKDARQFISENSYNSGAILTTIEGNQCQIFYKD